MSWLTPSLGQVETLDAGRHAAPPEPARRDVRQATASGRPPEEAENDPLADVAAAPPYGEGVP